MSDLGQRICFECGMKDPEGTERRMAEALYPEVGR